MLNGFGFLIGQIAVLLVLAVAIGLLAGRYVWPRATPRAAVPDHPVPPGPPAPAERDGSTRADPDRPPQAPPVPPATEAEKHLAEALRRVAEADAEVLRMRTQARAAAHQQEAEMGRLESGAISALESTIAAHTEQVTTLETQLREAEETVRRQEQELGAERRRAEQLQIALTERNEHVAELMSAITELERRAGAPSPEA